MLRSKKLDNYKDIINTEEKARSEAHLYKFRQEEGFVDDGAARNKTIKEKCKGSKVRYGILRRRRRGGEAKLKERKTPSERQLILN